MDPIVAYLLVRNIEKETKKNKENNENNETLVCKKKIRNTIKISCSRCGQNTYWCVCE
jgi:hypothetical protein